MSAATNRVSKFGNGLTAKVVSDCSKIHSMTARSTRDMKKLKFRDLAGDWLNVNAEDTVLDQIQFAAEVGITIALEKCR